ncbi:Proteasome subunit beta type-1 [Dirofilaria immitis]|nr:Proteasome subunit beta type-1 [Dirofilaria immitis]
MSLMDNFGMDSCPSGQMKAFKQKLAEVHASPPWMKPVLKEASEWNPYSFEGGQKDYLRRYKEKGDFHSRTTAAIAGDNFAIMASDTRMSQFEVNILTRDAEKIHILNDSIVLSCAGFYGDVLQLKRLLEARLHKYRFDYRGDMTVDLCAELLSRNLYYRRKGAVFSYDPIGCIEHIAYTASGSAEPMIMPFFDCQIGLVTMSGDVEKPHLTIERATSLIKDAFRVAAEREISTGTRYIW